MTTATTRIAAAILPHLSDPDVVDFMFASANGDSVALPTAVPASAPVSAGYFKKSLAHAVAIASHPGTDPAVLAKYAKDTRVTIRAALLANPATPYDAVLSLAQWAGERDDTVVLWNVFGRLEPEHLVELVETCSSVMRRNARYWGHWTTDESLDVILGKVRRDPALLRRLLAAAPSSVANRAAVLAHEGVISSLTLTELVDAIPAGDRRGALVQVLTSTSVMTVELAGLAELTAVHGAWVPQLEADAFTFVEPGAADRLAAADAGFLAVATALGASEEAVLDAAVTFGAEGLEALTTVLNQRRFSADFEQRLAGWAAGLDSQVTSTVPPAPLRDLLRQLQHRLPDDLMMGLLRAGHEDFTVEWLAGAGAPANPPLPGQLTRLLAEPGRALHAYSRSWHSRQRATQYEDVSGQFPMRLLSALGGLVNGPAGSCPEMRRELIAALDGVLAGYLSLRDVGALVGSHLQDVFGCDRRTWETFLTLASDWSDGFDRLLDATVTLTGTERGDRLQRTGVRPDRPRNTAVQTVLI